MEFQEHNIARDSERFRSLSPAPFFGADLRLAGGERHQIESALEAVAQETGLTLSGYLIENVDSATYHLSRYPRRRFGEPPSDQQLRECVQGIETYCTSRNQRLNATIEPKAERDEFRVVMGLHEGYLEAKKQDFLRMLSGSPEIEVAQALSVIPAELISALGTNRQSFSSLSELTEYIAATDVSVHHSAGDVSLLLGSQCRVVPGEILTVGPWGKYTEPAAIIEAPYGELSGVLELAERFHQERIAVEHLSAGQAWMVETVHCTDRDPQ